MKFVIFNVILFLLLCIFLESKEVKDYLSYQERQHLLLANILISNTIYFFDTPSIVIYILGILLISGYIDYRHREIPDIATIMSLGIVTIYLLFNMKNIFLIDMAMGLIIYLFFIISCLFGYIGGGDIKIFLPIVLVLGGYYFLLFLVLVGVAAILLQLILFIRTKKFDLSKEVALAPYFYISFLSLALIGIRMN